MQQLADKIETWKRADGGLRFSDPNWWTRGGTVINRDGTKNDLMWTKKDQSRLLPRKVILFTLKHDLLRIVINDWICPQCSYENRDKGEAMISTSVSRHRTLTVEVAYFWMQETMGRGMSFRSILELTFNLHNTDSYPAK